MMFFLNETFSSALAYTSQPYAELMDMQPDVKYTPYHASLRVKSGDIIAFSQFEEGSLFSETRDNT